MLPPQILNLPTALVLKTYQYQSYINLPTLLGTPLFLRAKVKWNYGDEIWFERTPIGHNLLQNRFKEMCKQAGLVGDFTNHSIRATAVTRMYESGLTEKMIMKRSGHRSTDGVRAYQREDASAQIKVSNALTSSSSLVASTEKSLISIITISEDDRLLVNACIDYEKSQLQINLGGILQGTTIQNVNINIKVNKN